MGREQSYEPIVPRKVEKRRAPATGGHVIHWTLEVRGEKADGLVEGDMTILRDRHPMSTQLNRLAEPIRVDG